MEQVCIQFLTVTVGLHAGQRGDLQLVSAECAVGLARAGMAAICGDAPGETIDPEVLAAALAEEERQAPGSAEAIGTRHEARVEEAASGPPPAVDQPTSPPAAAAPASLTASQSAICNLKSPMPAADAVGGPPATAAAWRLALAYGVELSAVAHAGDKITKADVQAHLAKP